ncbi:hypothetical protein AB833_09495 [Chromatiales bacterium (ex Bugula neritina AB1)]|nr:hypothetical protein AB833_09495 [Chromatiales bacterium (ex Bugula neritina AB1)]
MSNQFRVLLNAAAYVLMQELRLNAKGAFSLDKAQVTTIREKLLKQAVRLKKTTRRYVPHLSDTALWRVDWCAFAQRLGAVPT